MSETGVLESTDRADMNTGLRAAFLAFEADGRLDLALPGSHDTMTYDLSTALCEAGLICGACALRTGAHEIILMCSCCDCAAGLCGRCVAHARVFHPRPRVRPQVRGLRGDAHWGLADPARTHPAGRRPVHPRPGPHAGDCALR